METCGEGIGICDQDHTRNDAKGNEIESPACEHLVHFLRQRLHSCHVPPCSTYDGTNEIPVKTIRKFKTYLPRMNTDGHG